MASNLAHSPGLHSFEQLRTVFTSCFPCFSRSYAIHAIQVRLFYTGSANGGKISFWFVGLHVSSALVAFEISFFVKVALAVCGQKNFVIGLDNIPVFRIISHLLKCHLKKCQFEFIRLCFVSSIRFFAQSN